jgi:hypothetical protein
MVGARRFELPTYGTQNRRATRLRYAPTARFLRPKFPIEKPSLTGFEKIIRYCVPQADPAIVGCAI